MLFLDAWNVVATQMVIATQGKKSYLSGWLILLESISETRGVNIINSDIRTNGIFKTFFFRLIDINIDGTLICYNF